MTALKRCHDCHVSPGQAHQRGCDTEMCSVCGNQRIQCDHLASHSHHDPAFARWSGFWPGKLEADVLGMDLNTLHRTGLSAIFFIKPTGLE